MVSLYTDRHSTAGAVERGKKYVRSKKNYTKYSLGAPDLP